MLSDGEAQNDHRIVPMTLTVLTWNIMVDDYDHVRYSKIADKLATAPVDVICLQEVSIVGWYIINPIVTAAGWRALYPSPVSANSTFRTYGEMILFKDHNHPVEKGYFLLPVSAEGRSVQWMKLPGATIATGHLESGTTNVCQRRQQWSEIEKQFSDTEEPVYWVGDCNMSVDESVPSCGTLYNYGNTYFAARFAHGGSDQPYDRVWCSDSKLEQVQLCGRFGVDDGTGLAFSDHDGLILQLPSMDR